MKSSIFCRIKALFLVILLIEFFTQNAFSQREQDSLALVALYNSTNGPTWTNNTNWLSTKPISTWYGVFLTNKRVAAITLHHNNLSGSIPSEIGIMTNLEEIFLRGNKLTGVIPKQIGNLINLVYLDLDDNQLSGAIPPEIGNLTKLETLWLYFNQLNGTIPSEIGNLSNLKYLVFQNNLVSGPIPKQIGNLTNLLELNLGFNQLDSVIPKELGNLTNLQLLSLSNNQLSGLIPEELGSLSSLGILNLSYNQLNGTVPTTIGKLPNLGAIYLQNNKLDGLSDLSGLATLNNISVRSNLLEFFDLDSAKINWANFSYSYYPQNLILKLKKLVGESSINLTIDYTYPGATFQWYNNNISIPGETNKSLTIQLTDAGNFVCKTSHSKYPSLILSSETCSMNNLCSDSLALIAFYNSTGGNSWTNNTNWLSSQPVSSWYGITVTNDRITSIVLNNNNLVGTIPLEIWKLTELTSLALKQNQLTGSIPSEIGNLVKLQELDLSNNKFTNSIPIEIGNLTNLISLNLGANMLTGSIPSEIGNLSNLKNLYLYSNQLSGSIPSEICSLTNLNYLGLYNNQLSGSIPSEIGNLTNLTYLGIFSNKFTGSIPAQIGNLTNLTIISIRDNQLTGSIPIQVGNLSNLNTLYINDNLLSGPIPDEINNLTKLYTLQLKNNRFDVMPTLNISQLGYLSIQNNQFTFEDIEPNINVPKTSFTYSPQDSIGIKIDTTRNIGENFTFSVTCGGANNQYHWYKNGTIILTATNSTYIIPVLQLSDAGSYTCTITNTIVSGLTINSKPINLSVSEPTGVLDYDIEEILVYPNPTTGLLKIESLEGFSVEATIEIYDYYGKIVYLGQLGTSRFHEIDISYLSKGIYYIQIKNNNRYNYQKVVLQ